MIGEKKRVYVVSKSQLIRGFSFAITSKEKIKPTKGVKRLTITQVRRSTFYF
jgi:hypothetical protein